MKSYKHLLKHFSYLLIGCLLSYLLSYVSHPALPSMAQIANTASASFTQPGGQVAGAISNEVEFTTDNVAPPPGNPTGGLEIIKTADRSAAEPGDTIVYRLLVRNNGAVAADPLTVTDLQPLGLEFVEGSARTSPDVPPLNNVTVAGRQVTFELGALAPGAEVNIVYAALATPDSVRGSGLNTATASSPQFAPVSATFQLVIRPGILSDCGTIVGRVFVDKNFDGQQQPGEPGVPNAVIYMDDGNRIMTDPEGLFSIINVVSGYRSGTLDLSSLPGYILAPNLFRIEDNSQSRLVRLSPGGLARMNFAVTPTFSEERQ